MYIRNTAIMNTNLKIKLCVSRGAGTPFAAPLDATKKIVESTNMILKV